MTPRGAAGDALAQVGDDEEPRGKGDGDPGPGEDEARDRGGRRPTSPRPETSVPATRGATATDLDDAEPRRLP